MNYSNLLFIHIPKTGGQSVFSVINDNWKRTVPFRHDPLFVLENNNQISKQTYKFCVSRNPYTRTYSYYRHFLVQHPKHKNWNFETFLYSIKNKIFFPKTPMILYPQSFYVLNSRGEIDVNVFKYENIDQMKKRLNLDLPHLNKGSYSKTDYYTSYTPQNIKTVKEIYRIDFESFDYSLDFS